MIWTGAWLWKSKSLILIGRFFAFRNMAGKAFDLVVDMSVKMPLSLNWMPEFYTHPWLVTLAFCICRPWKAVAMVQGVGFWWLPWLSRGVQSLLWAQYVTLTSDWNLGRKPDMWHAPKAAEPLKDQWRTQVNIPHLIRTEATLLQLPCQAGFKTPARCFPHLSFCSLAAPFSMSVSPLHGRKAREWRSPPFFAFFPTLSWSFPSRGVGTSNRFLPCLWETWNQPCCEHLGSELAGGNSLSINIIFKIYFKIHFTSLKPFAFLWVSKYLLCTQVKHLPIETWEQKILPNSSLSGNIS